MSKKPVYTKDPNEKFKKEFDNRQSYFRLDLCIILFIVLPIYTLLFFIARHFNL